jgi:hypothetical protein
MLTKSQLLEDRNKRETANELLLNVRKYPKYIGQYCTTPQTHQAPQMAGEELSAILTVDPPPAPPEIISVPMDYSMSR